ncbi:hypothetical protein PQX77_013318 [Marasmius sp. AFHP31]|nr:hypothetical protein PQX77_013318 [Marasmius sp. AFHP31]
MSTPTSPPPATTATASSPPYYILFTQAGASTSSNTLGHPTIQYHYADDSPLNLLPQSPDEHVLLLDYDPSSTQISVDSTSESMAVTGLKFPEAPGTAALEEKRNDRMYIIETTSSTDKTWRNDRQHSAQAILTQFKQRNAALRHALTFNGTQNAVLSPASPSKLPEVHELSLKQL